MGEGRRSASEMSRYTVEEAAALLGMTVGAVRNRLSKGILRSVEERGTVYVLLPAYLSRDAPRDAPATYRVRRVRSCRSCASG